MNSDDLQVGQLNQNLSLISGKGWTVSDGTENILCKRGLVDIFQVAVVFNLNVSVAWTVFDRLMSILQVN